MARRENFLEDLLKDLEEKCVSFHLVSNTQITGFVQDVEDGVVTLFVSGKTVYLVAGKIEWFQEAEGAAC
ncbi:MAG TPA: hypothetical protein VGK74_12485 [Symbiobacteriaceae bacterium]